MYQINKKLKICKKGQKRTTGGSQRSSGALEIVGIIVEIFNVFESLGYFRLLSIRIVFY